MVVLFIWRCAPSRLEFCVPASEVIINYLCSASPADTESRSLQLMACRGRLSATALLPLQMASGAWSVGRPGAGPENCFHTTWALLALKTAPPSQEMSKSAARAFAWLDSIIGVEDHWLWKWKFRYFDRQVRFDPTKTGWPWVAGTVSWVAPTAMAILAHRAWGRRTPRLTTAIQMILDRACPQGGWNAGNSEVFGVALDPHPDFTAMSLLALHGQVEGGHSIVVKSLDYLAVRLKDVNSLYSLGWATLALRAWQHGEYSAMAVRLQRQVVSMDPVSVPLRALGIAAVACDPPTFLLAGGQP